MSYRLLKRADIQQVLRQSPYQRFLNEYSSYAAPPALGTPDASAFVRAVLLDPKLRNAFRYGDLSTIAVLSDERLAMQLAASPQHLTELLKDPVVLEACRRRAVDEGPAAYATRIAQEINFQSDYRRAIFDRLAIAGDLILARCGKSVVIGSLSDFGIAKELWSTQEFELGAFQAYLSLRGGRRLAYFIDVGANLGTHTLYALREANFAKALAIEPDPRSLPLLRANLALNGVDGRATVLPLAVSSGQGSTVLYQSTINWGDNRTFRVDGCKGWTNSEVPTTSPIRFSRTADSTRPALRSG